jgi:hypothetical protein
LVWEGLQKPTFQRSWNSDDFRAHFWWLWVSLRTIFMIFDAQEMGSCDISIQPTHWRERASTAADNIKSRTSHGGKQRPPSSHGDPLRMHFWCLGVWILTVWGSKLTLLQTVAPLW